jgi:hypothetical protein
MKTIMTTDMWRELEAVLAKLNVGYVVSFDNHNGTDEMLINVSTIGVMRFIDKE